MTFVDPNFDTYSLDACAKYGIIAFDPCQYLTGQPSPYLRQYFRPCAMKPDSFELSNHEFKNGKPLWKKLALGALALGVIIFGCMKAPNLAKRLVPKSIREFSIKNTWESVCNKVKEWCK